MSGDFQPAPPVNAGATVRGLLSTLAQTIAGAKTFAAAVVMSAGLTITGLLSATKSRMGTGSASDVAYGSVGDDNNGFWFPAADTINMVTAGALRMQLDSSGVVWVTTQLKLDSAGRVINVPQLVLPGGAGGYGYGGGLEIGGTFNGLHHNGVKLYLQAYNSTANLESFTNSAVVSGFTGSNPGASDICVKLGTNTARASLNVATKLVSFRDTIGGSETEYGYVTPIQAGGASAFRTVMTLDSKSQTHVGGLAIINEGVGDTGIFWGSAGGAGGATMGNGSIGNRGLMVNATNRTMSWYINSGAFSGSARAIFDWECVADAYQKTIPFLRYQADAAHTADLARWYKGATLEASINANGVLTAAGVVAEGGLSVNGGGAEITGALHVTGDEPIQLGSGLAADMTTPPVGMLHEITINASKGRGIHSGTWGSTKVNCDKCTADSVVVVVLEDPTGNITPAVIPDDGFFTLQNDGGGYWDVTFRFVVFN